MATAPPISQRIRLDGSEEIQQNLVKLGELGERAFEQMRRAAANLNFQGVSRDMKAVGDAAAQVASGAGRLSEEIGKLSGSSRDAGSALTSFGSATAHAASTADRAASSISSVVKTFALLGAGLVAVGASIIASAKSAATAASEIGKAADTLGQDDIESYQKLNFVLRQLGLTSGEADAAIKKMGEGADDAAVKLSKTALELQSLFQSRGTSFAPTAQGFNLMRRELAGLAQQAAQGTIPFATLRDMLAKFQDETDPNKLKAFQNELAKLVDASKGAPNAMRGVINVMRDTEKEATGIVTPLQEVRNALAAMQKDTSPENLVRFAAALTGIENEATRTKFAVGALGEFAGRRLVSELESSDSAISQLIARYGQLRIGVSDADREISDKFNAALTEMAVVSRQSRTELGLLFAPALTPLITNFNTLMRANSGTLLNFGATIRDAVIPVLEDLLKMFQGAGDAEIKTEWLVTLREGFKSAGKVIKEILLPAFSAAERAARFLITTVNEFFGSKFTLADAGILGAVTLLIGGFNALAVAVLAVFTSATPSIADFKEKLKGIGIDIDAIKKTFKGFAQSVSADLKAMSAGNNDAVQNKWLLDFKEIMTGLPGIIVGVVGALTLLGRAIKFIGADKAILVFLAQITGILPIFATLLIGAAAVSTILVNGLKVLGLALAGIVGLIGWPATLVAGLAVLLFNMEKAKVVFDAFAAALNSLFGTKLDGLDLQIGAILGIVAALALVVTRAAAARTALLSLSAIPIVAAFLGIHQVVKDLAGSGGPLDVLDNKIEALSRQLAAGTLSVAEYERKVAELRGASAAAATKDTATGVADEWKKITDTLKGVSTQSNQTVQTVKSGWAQVSPGVWQKMSDESGKAVDQINSKWQQLAPGVFQRLGTDVKRATDEIKGGVAAAGTTADAFKASLSQLPPVVGQAFATAGPAIDAFRAQFNALPTTADAFKASLNQLAPAATQAFGAIGPAADQSFGVAEQSVNDFKSRFGELPAATDLFKSALGTLAPILDRSLGVAGRGVNDLKSRFNELPDTTDAFKAKLNELPPVVSQAFTATASAIDAFKFKFDGLPNTTDAFKSALGTLAPIVDQSLGAAEQGVSNLKSRFDELPTTTDAFKATLNQLSPVVSQAFTAAGPAIDTFNAQLSGLPATADAFKASLTLLPTTIGQAFATAGPPIDAFKAQFSGLPTTADAFKASITQLAPVATQAFGAIGPAVDQSLGVAEQSVNDLKSRLGELPGAIQGFVPEFNKLPSLIERAATAATNLGTSFTAGLSGVTGLIDGVGNSMDSLIQKIDAAIVKLGELASAQSESGASSFDEAGFEGFARGGQFRGRPGRDTNLAWLTDKEYVMQVPAVKKYGVGFMRMINSMALPRDAFRGFNAGGFVDGLNRSMSALMIPRFNAGGLADMVPAMASAAGGRPLVINMPSGSRYDGTIVDVMGTFEREALALQNSATGTLPSWVGGGSR